jgi:hypothetical protein
MQNYFLAAIPVLSFAILLSIGSSVIAAEKKRSPTTSQTEPKSKQSSCRRGDSDCCQKLAMSLGSNQRLIRNNGTGIYGTCMAGTYKG